MKPQMTSADIEIAVANHFGYRVNIIVPNVSWGLFNHQEVDLLILRPSGYCEEIEIKVTAADIRRDKKKGHAHWNPKLRRTWFAVPKALAESADIPEYAGILSVERNTPSYSLFVKMERAAKLNPAARKLTANEFATVGRLAAMRIWTLKSALLTQLNNKRYQESKRNIQRDTSDACSTREVLAFV